jgi:hypothetical protein
MLQEDVFSQKKNEDGKKIVVTGLFQFLNPGCVILKT